MGFYIQGPALCKAQYDGKIIPKPKSYSDIPLDKALICVINNVMFEAAGYCFSEKEFVDFGDSSDPRPKTWLIMDKKMAEDLSGYKTADPKIII